MWADDMSLAYDEHLVSAVFRPYADDLASRVERHRPRVVLELAAGTGVLTLGIIARLPTAQVTATDLNAAMDAVGSANALAATWLQADAMQLPFGDAGFDVVACQFGVMFFPDRIAAYAEVARVLRPGGHFLFNCWGPLSGHDVETAVMAALAEVFPDDPPTFLARVPHGYHDVERLTADLTAAGFRSVDVVTLELDCRARDVASVARGYCRGTPLRADIEARGDLEVATLAVTDALRRRFGAGQVVGRMTAHIVTAEEGLRPS